MKRGFTRFIASSIAFVMVLGLFTGCGASAKKAIPATAYDTENALTVDQMKQDLDYLEEGLEYYHANAWHSISKADFEAAKTELESRLEGMTRTQFQYEISRLVALIGDAHTSASFNVQYTGYRQELPFAVKDFDDGWYIIKTDTAHKDSLGWRIDQIGKFEIDQVTDMVKPYFSTETESWTRYEMCGCMNNWDLLHVAGVVDSETVTLKLSKDGKTKKVQYTAAPHPDCYDSMDAALSSLDSYKMVETSQSDDYYRYMEFDNMLFVQYNVCKENSAKPMADFVAELTQKQNAKKYQNLVIDLRYNTGGSSTVISPLCTFTDAFVKAGGNFYLLVGEKTFSSGMLALTSLRPYNPLIIGIPTGGGENHYGNVASTIQLKNCGIKVGCATSWFQKLADPTVASAMPDIVAKHTFDDYFNGIDPELEIVKKLISGELAKPEPQKVKLAVKVSWTYDFDIQKYPWVNSMDGGFDEYLGSKKVFDWLSERYLNNVAIYPGPMAAIYAKDFGLTPEELVAVMRYDNVKRIHSRGKTDSYYTEDDIKFILEYAYGSSAFDEAAVPVINLNTDFQEFWSLYGTEPIENMETLGASVENAIPWSFITEVGIKNYLEWANGLTNKNEYTLQNFLKYFKLSVVAYDDVFNRIKQAGGSFYTDQKIAEIRTQVYGY